MASTWLPSVQQGLAANRPGTPDIARGTIAFYYATDTGALTMYVGNTWNIDEVNNGDGTWVPGNGYSLVDATGATLAVAATSNQVIQMDRAGGATYTLPPSTGSGITIEFIVKTVSTTGYIIQVNATPGTDTFQGIIISDKAGTPINYTAATGDIDTITLNGTTTGGVNVGDRIALRDIAAGFWQTTGFVEASGTQATPFSDAT